MKRALLITLEYPPQIGGVAHYYSSLVQHVTPDRIAVLDNSKNELLSRSRWVWPKWLRAIFRVRAYAKQTKSECILVGQVLPLGTVAYICKRLFGIPYIVMTHGMDVTAPVYGPHARRRVVLMRRIFAHASCVTTVSQFTAEQLCETFGVQRDKLVLLSPCPYITPEDFPVTQDDLSALNTRYALTQDMSVIVCPGRQVVRKGFDVTILAYARLAKRFPHTRLVLVGDGPDAARLKSIIQEQGVEDRVLCVGAVTSEELATWYARSTVVVMPSRALPQGDVEGFGIVYLEANAFGKPVIGGDSGGIRDAVIDGKTGYIVDPEDIAMLHDALERIVTRPEEASKMGDYGRTRVLRDFHWGDRAQILEHRIEQI